MANIYNDTSNTIITGTADVDSIVNSSLAANVTIETYDGNDYIYNDGSSVTINAGAGNDYIYNYWGSSVTIDAGAGNDTVYNFGSSVTINTGAGADTIYNRGSSVTIDAGDGNDSIFNSSGTPSVKIDAGDGNDSIVNDSYSSNVTIDTGNGNDTIWNRGSSGKIDAGDGNDTIRNDGDMVKIDAGAGDDSISNGGGSNVTIYAGDGNDDISNTGSSVTIDAGAGDDSIYSSGSSVTIDAGDGNDFINNSSGGNSSNGSFVTINAGVGNDSISNHGSNVKISAGDGNDSIWNWGSSVTINAGAGDDRIDNVYSSSSVTIDAGAGDDNIVNGGSSVKIDAGDGNDSISNYGVSVKIYAGDGNDSIRNEGSSVTIDAGAGDDSIILGSEVRYFSDITTTSVLLYNEGDGNDTVSIAGPNAQYTLQVESSATPTTVNSGSDLVVQVGDGSITFLGQANHTLNIVDPSGTAITLVSPSDTTTGGTDSDTTTGGTDSDTTTGGTDSDTTTGGTDSDTTTGGTDSDTTTGGTDSDTTTGGTDSDTTTGGTDSDTTTGGTDSDTVNAHGVTLSNSISGILFEGTEYDDSLRNESTATNVTVKSYGDRDSILNYAESITIDAGAGNNYIRNGDTSYSNTHGFYTYIIAGEGDDTIWNNGRYVTIDAGAGNDSILTDIYPSPFQDVTVFGGDGDDTIVVNDDSCSLNGGPGNDYISVMGGTHWTGNTLEGGTGDDTLYGGGNNVFFYQEGDGNDTVHNFTISDRIQINSNTPYTSVVSGNDIRINIGSGSMLLVGASKYYSSIDVYYGEDALSSKISVDLATVPDNTAGIFVVPVDSDGAITSSVASFKSETEAAASEVIVGNVTANKIYSGVSDSEYRQIIEIPDSWNVTATNNNDSLKVAGNGVTVTGGTGNDSISIGSDVTNVVLNDLTIAEDKLYFAKAIAANSLKRRFISNALALTSDAINLTFKNLTNASDESALTNFYNFNVNNGGASNTISDLLFDRVSYVTVDLNSMPRDGEGYAVISSANTDHTPTATFTPDFYSDDYEQVGLVKGEGVYVADDHEAAYNQRIIVPDDWDATGTENDDVIIVTGDRTTISGNLGSDEISIGSGVKHIIITDLDLGATVETTPATLEPASETEEVPVLMRAMVVEAEPAFLMASAAVETEPTFLLAASEDASVQPDKDTLIFADRIDKDSLVWTFDPEAVTLASDDLEIVLYGVTELNDDILNYEITSGGVTNKIQDLLKVTVDEVTVNLSDASTTGSFYISEYNLESSAEAVFGSSTGSDDTVVGAVTAENVYAADSDSVKQIINVAENWSAAATDNDDRLNVLGSATIASGEGRDTISVAGGVTSLTFADFNTGDRLIFDERIEKGSMLQTVDGGAVIIYSDEMSITWQGVDSLTNEILDYSFSNGSTRATIEELLIPDTIVAVDLDAVAESETGEFAIVDYADSSLQTAEFLPNDGSMRYNGHSYRIFSDVNLTWDAAKAYAESLGGHLVTITDAGEQAALETWLRAEENPKNSYWLGGYKDSDNLWQWISGETIPAGGDVTLAGAAYSNWSWRQPDGDGDKLMLYYNQNYYSRFGQWNDFNNSGVNGQEFFGVENIGLIVEWDSAEEFVGTVSSDKVYDADTDSDAYRQAITVGENWIATATDGDDSINVIDDNATIISGGGRDTIHVGHGVSTVTFADIDTAADKLIFTDKIAENSLQQTVGENEVTLASDRISLVWQGTGALTDNILNYSVNNGGDTNTILDLLEVQVEQVTVELGDVPENETGYFIVANGNKNSLPTAEFEAEKEIRGTIVGSIITENFYVADESDRAYKQTVNVAENWYANATAKDDFINVNGDATTIASGLGNDTISVAGGVESITLTDFDTAADTLIFAKRIATESLTQEAGDGFVNLVSDDFSMTWRGVSELSDDILNFEIINGRNNRNTIRELLAPDSGIDDIPTINEVTVNPDASITIAFSHWQYGFNPAAENAPSA